jgi:hypothetical protein
MQPIEASILYSMLLLHNIHTASNCPYSLDEAAARTAFCSGTGDLFPLTCDMGIQMEEDV